MWELPVVSEAGGIVALHRPPREAMLAITTRIALVEPVCVLDAGNQFDAWQVARLARRHTVDLDRVLGRLQVARAFTCYQVVSLFEAAAAAAVAHVVFNLLATFYDESVPLDESYQLLKIVGEHLNRLRDSTPVVILSVYPPRQKGRLGLVELALKLADQTFTWDEPEQPEPAARRLAL